MGRGWKTLAAGSLRLHVTPVIRQKPLTQITRIDVVAVFVKMPVEQAATAYQHYRPTATRSDLAKQ